MDVNVRLSATGRVGAWALAIFAAWAGSAASDHGTKPASPRPASADEQGFDPSALDPSVDPCDNFYRYTCGRWLKRTELPPDRAVWFRSFSPTVERSLVAVREMLDELAAGRTPGVPHASALGHFWNSCLAEEQIEKTAPGELKALLARIEAVKDLRELAAELARQHLHGVRALFKLHSAQDLRDASQVIALLEPGGLGMPDPGYYTDDAPKLVELRRRYRTHLRNLLALAGVPDSDRAAQTVLRLEQRLAERSPSRAERRDPRAGDHRQSRAALEKSAPHFPWREYLAELGHPQIATFNVTAPPFFAALSDELAKLPLADVRLYLEARVIDDLAPLLSKGFVEEAFAFDENALRGNLVPPPRWKVCVRATDAALGDFLARPFAQRMLGDEGKAGALAVMKQVRAATEAHLARLSWMDEATRTAALAKLRAIDTRIGFPEKWRDTDLSLGSGSYLASTLAARELESRVDLDLVGKPVDRADWRMTPLAVRGDYDPQLNAIVFSAAVLQPPAYDPLAHPAVNFGAIGMTMGHELIHAFDDQGRRFDASGNLGDWWTPAVSREFERRAACLIAQFDEYVAIDGLHVNGRLTLGENIADLGGLELAHAAYMLARKPGQVGAFTDEQLFFISAGQSYCTKERDAFTRLRATSNAHAPAELRMNGALSNLPAFAAAFHCRAGAKMVRRAPCVVW